MSHNKEYNTSITLFLVMIAFSIGIYSTQFISWPMLPLVVVFLVVIGLIFLNFYLRKSLLYFLLLLFFIAGIFRVLHSEYQPPYGIRTYVNQQIILQGEIAGSGKTTKIEDKYKTTFPVEVKQVQKSGEKMIPSSGNIQVTVLSKGDAFDFQKGFRLQLTGELQPLSGYKNPGMYDSTAALKQRGIVARMTVKKEEVRILSTEVPFSFTRFSDGIKERMLVNMKTVMPEVDAAILSGMLFGGYAGIPPTVVKAFSATGVVHILSVSGSHIALLAGLMLLVGEKMRNWVGMPNTFAPCLAAVFVILYAVFCGLTPPVLRSVIMGLLALGALFFKRERASGNAFCIAALGMLAYQPELLYDLSFQLSFGASGGLIFLYQKTLDKLIFLPRYIAELTAVVIAAQLGVLPFLSWYFHTFSLVALIANTLITPIISCVIPLGLAGCVLSLLHQALGMAFLIPSSLLVGLMIESTGFLSRLPWATIYMPSMGLWAGLVYYFFLAWCYGYVPKVFLNRELFKGRPSLLVAGGMTLVFVAIFFCVSNMQRDLQVHFIDVGQGDAALIITPRGKSLLVDTGGVASMETSFDIGERVVLPYLRHYGVTHLQYLFLTHGHQDHAGGAAAIVENLPVDTIFLSREEPSQAVRNMLGKADKSIVIQAFSGQQIELDGVVVEVLHAAYGQNQGQNRNEVSGVIRVSYGKASFLFTGDLEKQGEMEVLQKGGKVKSTVLKVGHHGSKSSSSDEFVRAVSPEYAVISVGGNNSFGHPHQETLQRFLDNRVEVFRTDKQGAIVFSTNGSRIKIDTYQK